MAGDPAAIAVALPNIGLRWTWITSRRCLKNWKRWCSYNGGADGVQVVFRLPTMTESHTLSNETSWLFFDVSTPRTAELGRRNNAI